MSAIQINNQIHCTGQFRLIELPAGGTIYPGMLVKEIASSPATVPPSGSAVVHATAGGFAERLFANEDALQGGTTLGYGSQDTGLYTGYTVAGRNGFGPDRVQITAEEPGNLVMALCLAGTHYTIGMQLISHGDGTLYPTTGTPSQIIGLVVQDTDLSSSVAVNSLVQIRVL